MAEFNDLQMSRIDLQKVADFLPYPFIIAEIIDGIHLNTHLNEKFIQEISYTLEEIPTIEAWYEHAYPDETYRQSVINNWDQEERETVREGKASLKKKSLVTRKDGSKHWYEIKATVIGMVHVVAFVDLDKEILLQEELKNKNLNNDRMLSILGHDLRSPIANLMAISSMAVDADITDGEFTEVIKLINAQSAHVLELLDNTMHWSKLNFNAITVNLSEIGLHGLINCIIATFHTSIENKKLNVQLDTSKMETVTSDVEILTIIVRNLLSNAIKFTPENGSIEIRSQNNQLIISDSGTGMSQTMIDALRKQQYNSKKGTNNEPGTGLGLQLVVNLSEKINCSLEIESEESKGTIMRLNF